MSELSVRTFLVTDNSDIPFSSHSGSSVKESRIVIARSGIEFDFGTWNPEEEI